MIAVQILELDTSTGTYRQRALLQVTDEGAMATDTGEPTGLEDVAVHDPATGRFVTAADDAVAWARGLPAALRSPYLIADVRELGEGGDVAGAADAGA